MKKKILSLLLVGAMIMSTSGSALSAGATETADKSSKASAEIHESHYGDDILTYGNYEYTVESDNTVTITQYIGNETNVVIPSTIDSKAVTSIGYAAFYNCQNLKSISISDNTTNIESGALGYCTSLTDVKLPANLTYIPISLFEGDSSLENIVIPNKVTEIDANAFCGCTSLKKIEFPESVKKVSSSAFSFCKSLSEVYIPETLTDMSYTTYFPFSGNYDKVTITVSPFTYCTNLKAINVSENNPNYSSEDGILFNKDKTTLIQYPCGKQGKRYEIPSTVKELSGSINAFAEISAFYGGFGGIGAFTHNQYLETVIIPDSIEEIPISSFREGQKLKRVSISESVKHIGSDAFSNCNELTSILIPDSVTSIGDDYSPLVFGNCEKLTIYGNENSTAEKYAANFNISFKALSKFPNEEVDTDNDPDITNKNIGDVDDDGKITSADALFVLRASVNLEKLDNVKTKLSDVDGDGNITSADSLAILRYSVGLKDSNILITL